MTDDTREARDPSLVDVAIPVVLLVGLLGLAVYLFGEDASWGPNQIALTLCALVAAAVGLKNGHRWDDIREGVGDSIMQAMPAIFILLAVGALVGTWVMCGTVPSMIYLGLKFLSPAVFYPSALIVCAIISASIGSSWTTVGTIGVGMIGIANGLGLSEPAAAGAIVCGAYFGDKLSPLSDTTNLAPAVAGSDLYTHIKHMLWTTIPSVVIALVIFTVMGLRASSDESAMAGVQETMTLIDSHFAVGWHLLIPIAVVLAMALRKMPPFPVIMIGALVGGAFAVLFQPDQVVVLAGDDELPRGLALTAGVWQALVSGFEAQTGVDVLDDLLSRGGMASMLEVIWLVLSALMFGGVMEKTGMLRRLVQLILGAARGTGSLIAATIFTGIGVNVIASDQYMAIVLPGRMFRLEFEDRGLAPQNLSRALEDSGTITSPLVPWNTCGAYMAGTLGVATIAYLPFAFFNLLCPLISLGYGFTGFTIVKLENGAGSASEDRSGV